MHPSKNFFKIFFLSLFRPPEEGTVYITVFKTSFYTTITITETITISISVTVTVTISLRCTKTCNKAHMAARGKEGVLWKIKKTVSYFTWTIIRF